MYGKMGFEPSEIDQGLIAPLIYAIGVVVALALIAGAPFAIDWGLFSRWKFVLAGCVVVLASEILWGETTARWALIAGARALVISSTVDGVRQVRVRRSTVVTGKVFGMLVSLVMLTAVWFADPPSYRERLEGPLSLTQLIGLGVELPGDAVMIDDGTGSRPVVLLARDNWMKMIDPCTELPYSVFGLRFDQVNIVEIALDEALETYA